MQHQEANRGGATSANPGDASVYSLVPVAPNSYNCTTWAISQFNNLHPIAPITNGGIEPYSLAHSIGNGVEANGGN